MKCIAEIVWELYGTQNDSQVNSLQQSTLVTFKTRQQLTGS